MAITSRKDTLNVIAGIAILLFFCTAVMERGVELSSATGHIFLCFHVAAMPLMVLCMGIGLSKQVQMKRFPWQAVIGVMAAYLLLCAVNGLLSGQSETDVVRQALDPQDSAWMLPATAIWICFARMLRGQNLLRLIIWSVVLGIAAGYCAGAGSFLCLSPCIVFFPFFLLGCFENEQTCLRVKKWWGLFAIIAAVLLSILIAVLLPAEVLPQAKPVLLGATGYREIGGSGGLLRAGWYGLSLFLCVGLLSLQQIGQVPCRLFAERMPLFLFTFLLVMAGGEGLPWQKQALWCAAALVSALAAATTMPHLTKAAQRIATGVTAKYKCIPAKKTQAIRFYLLFSAIFSVLSGVVLLYFRLQGYSTVRVGDGTNQYFPTMHFVGTILKETLSNFISTGHFSFPMVDYRLGMGMDVLTTLNGFMADDLLAAFVPSQQIALLYDVLVAVRMWAMGLFFCIYCRVMGKRRALPVLAGAVTYVFCGYFLMVSIQHVSLTTGFIFLPLLMTGVERVLRGRHYGVLVAAVALAMFFDFYHCYVDLLLLMVYALLRIFPILRSKGLSGFLRQGLPLMGAVLCGLGVSAVIFFPICYAYLTSARVSVDSGYQDSMLYYPFSYYTRLIANFFLPDMSTDSYLQTNFLPIALPCIVLLFMRRNRRDAALKTGFLLLVIFTCVPLAGKAFNGFSYVTNRWCYALALAVGLVVVWAFPGLAHMGQKERVTVLSAAVIYAAFVILSGSAKENLSLAGLAMLGLTISALLCLPQSKSLQESRFIERALFGVTVCGALTYFVVSYSPNFGNAIGTFAEVPVMKTYEQQAVSAVNLIEDEDFYRVGQKQMNSNYAALFNFYGVMSYYSLTPEIVTEYYTELEMDTARYTYIMSGLDGRADLNALASVKYFIVDESRCGIVPFGFELYKENEGLDGKTDLIFKNRYALPLGYTYDSIIDRETYDELLPLEKQAVQLSSAVLSETPEGLCSENIGAPLADISFQIVETDGVEIIDNEIRVTKTNATMTLEFCGQPNSETYLSLHGLHYRSGGTTSADSVIDVLFDNGSRRLWVLSPSHIAYFPRDGYTVNLGYSQEGLTKCTIKFMGKRVYTYEDISLTSYSMDSFTEKVARLNEETLCNIQMSPNRVTGNINVSSKKILQLSIPYSSGWSARVDEIPQPLLRSNTLYCALVLEQGEHEIEMTYCTPYLKEGAIVSALSIFGFLAFSVLRRRRAIALLFK